MCVVTDKSKLYENVGGIEGRVLCTKFGSGWEDNIKAETILNK